MRKSRGWKLVVMSVAAFVGAGLPGNSAAGGMAQPTYDQLDAAHGTSGTVSQSFQSEFEDLDTEVADDFIVPIGGDYLSSVEVLGDYYLDPEDEAYPDWVTLRIYEDDEGFPGELVMMGQEEPVDGFEDPNFEISLLDQPGLSPGSRYWLSIQVEQVSGNHWFWRNRTIQDNNSAVLRNPGGGWLEGECTSWAPRWACIGGGDSQEWRDQVFKITFETAEPACSDGDDNDYPEDGKVDFPEDPGCSSTQDDDERNSSTLTLNVSRKLVEIGPGEDEKMLVASGKLSPPRSWHEHGAEIVVTLAAKRGIVVTEVARSQRRLSSKSVYRAVFDFPKREDGDKCSVTARWRGDDGSLPVNIRVPQQGYFACRGPLGSVQ